MSDKNAMSLTARHATDNNGPRSVAGNAVLLALFALLIPCALLLGLRYRTALFTTAVVTGLALEVMGYIGRVLLARAPDDNNTSELALAAAGTVVGPAFICLALFRLVGRVAAAYGRRLHPWSTAWHNVAVYGLAAVSVVLQTVGSVLSTVLPAESRTSGVGIALVVAGLAVQAFGLLVFAVLGLRFASAVRRQRRGRSDTGQPVAPKISKFRAFVAGTTLVILLLLIRTLYRIVPVARGYSSPVAQNETLFLVLDGAFVLVATALLLALYPGCMPEADPASHRVASFYYHGASTRPPRPYRPSRPTTSPKPAPYDMTWNRSSIIAAETSSSAQPPLPRRQSSQPPALAQVAEEDMVDSDALW